MSLNRDTAVGWFGVNWGAPICEPSSERPVPIGDTCPQCNRVFRSTDIGVLIPHPRRNDAGMSYLGHSGYHRACLLRIIGVDSERPG